MTSKIINIMNEGKFNIMVLTDKHSNYGITEKWFGTEYDEKGKKKKQIFFLKNILTLIFLLQISQNQLKNSGTLEIIRPVNFSFLNQTSLYAANLISSQNLKDSI